MDHKVIASSLFSMCFVVLLFWSFALAERARKDTVTENLRQHFEYMFLGEIRNQIRVRSGAILVVPHLKLNHYRSGLSELIDDRPEANLIHWFCWIILEYTLLWKRTKRANFDKDHFAT